MIGNENNPENVPTKKEVNDLIQRISVLEDLLCVGKEVLTLEEAALFMGISRSTLYKMTHSSAIPFYRPNGKLIYFEKSELLAWMRRRPLVEVMVVFCEGLNMSLPLLSFWTLPFSSRSSCARLMPT